jgi:hypothetical protein
MTSNQHRELEMVRWRLDRMCRHRDQVPFSVPEEDLYRELTQLEAQLLSAAA